MHCCVALCCVVAFCTCVVAPLTGLSCVMRMSNYFLTSRPLTKKTAGFLGFYPLSAAKRSANMEWAGGNPGENPSASWVFLVTDSRLKSSPSACALIQQQCTSSGVRHSRGYWNSFPPWVLFRWLRSVSYKFLDPSSSPKIPSR